MKLVDLSHPISNLMSTYPSDPKTLIVKKKEIEANRSLLHSITMGTHSGTHLDTPAHILKEGKTLSDFPLSSFMGKAIKINEKSTLNFNLKDIDGVIFETRWSRFYKDSKKYFGNGRPKIPIRLINKLIKANLKFFGCDLPSVDSTGSEDKPVHNALLGNDIIIYESLASLDKIPTFKKFNFIGLPLYLHKLEASPVRAIAIIE